MNPPSPPTSAALHRRASVNAPTAAGEGAWAPSALCSSTLAGSRSCATGPSPPPMSCAGSSATTALHQRA
eukprot:12994254-Alexandrium_andersonii.AAC.1